MRFSAPLVLAVLLGLNVYCPAARTNPADEVQSVNLTLLNLFNFHAVANLDPDDEPDLAKLDIRGIYKRIEISFNPSAASQILQFETRTLESGSLLAFDVNGDGGIDLVWFNFHQPDAAMVWEADGSGRFKHLSSGLQIRRFLIGSPAGLGAPSGVEKKIRAGSARNQSLTHPAILRTIVGVPTRLPALASTDLLGLGHCPKPQTNRGPPQLLTI